MFGAYVRNIAVHTLALLLDTEVIVVMLAIANFAQKKIFSIQYVAKYSHLSTSMAVIVIEKYIILKLWLNLF